MNAKRRFQFKISTALLATACIAIALLWLLSVFRHSASQKNKFLSLVRQSGVHGVMYEHKVGGNHMAPFMSRSSAPSFLINLLGDGYFCDISVFQLENCGNPTQLLTDAVAIGRLRMIRLTQCTITPESATLVSGMHDLKWLGLAYSKIDDQIFKSIAGMPQLKILDLRGTQVSKNSLSLLASFSNLEYLYLNKANFDDASLAELRESLPSCKIQFEFNRWPELAETDAG